VSQQMDSRERSFRQLHVMNGMMDEQYLVGLAEKVHRGQEGRVLKGLVAGGRCYGYKNVPLEDFSRLGEYGRPAIIGVRQEIIPEEARVILRMFEMCAEGRSLATTAKEFNSAKILAPRPRRGTCRHGVPMPSIRCFAIPDIEESSSGTELSQP
jgi:DNA invertase Pin-like site-specific DNA recombinase